MSEEKAFLSILRRQPKDLLSMRVYADWLEDHGQPDRAEFLRLQLEAMTMRPSQRGLVTRSRRLLALGRHFPRAWLLVVNRPRLDRTAWVGRSSSDGFCIYRYLRKGVLNYSTENGTYQNGTWWQIGNQVFMETNAHYADYQGTIASGRILGRASNITGHEWTWDVSLTTDPKECDPGDPDTTVYAHHATERRRRPRRPPRPL
jgi:uncharacterized protein (TIGR02996 family)